MVVNDQKTPPSIFSGQLSDLPMISKKFLDAMTAEGLGNGVKRYRCYILNLGTILRFPNDPSPNETTYITRLTQLAKKKGYDLLQINF